MRERGIQCDKIGRFLVTHKVAHFDFLGYFEKHPFLSKNCGGYLLGNLWNNLGSFFILTSGHIGQS